MTQQNPPASTIVCMPNECTTSSQGDIRGDVKQQQQKDYKVFEREWINCHTHVEDDDVSFSVVTYNVLCDAAIVRSNGFYDYCPADVRYMKDRHGHMMAEIKAMNADVVCMQEVSAAHFEGTLQPDMSKMGYDAVPGVRTDDYSMATFYKKDVFSMVEKQSWVLCELVEDLIKEANVNGAIAAAIRAYVKRPEMCLLLLLEHIASKKQVAIANIHVLWEMLKYPDVQALQISCALSKVVETIGGLESETALILLGDFNTPPDYPAYSMLRDKHVEDTETGRGRLLATPPISTDNQSEQLVNILPSGFRIDVDLDSAYSKAMGREPDATNADEDDGYHSLLCLDYIWYARSRLTVDGVLWTPPIEDMNRYVALPSVLFPSDHVPMKAQFSFI